MEAMIEELKHVSLLGRTDTISRKFSSLQANYGRKRDQITVSVGFSGVTFQGHGNDLRTAVNAARSTALGWSKVIHDDNQ